MKLDKQQFIADWHDLKRRLQQIHTSKASETIEKYSKIFEP